MSKVCFHPIPGSLPVVVLGKPVAWIPKPGDFVVRSAGGATFEDVEFDEGTWAEYDGDAELPVSITNLTSVFEVC